MDLSIDASTNQTNSSTHPPTSPKQNGVDPVFWHRALYAAYISLMGAFFWIPKEEEKYSIETIEAVRSSSFPPHELLLNQPPTHPHTHPPRCPSTTHPSSSWVTTGAAPPSCTSCSRMIRGSLLLTPSNAMRLAFFWGGR